MMKAFYNDVYREDHSSQYGGGSDGMPERAAVLTTATQVWLATSGLGSRPSAAILDRLWYGVSLPDRSRMAWRGVLGVGRAAGEGARG